MFDIGFWEMTLIGVIALLVITPVVAFAQTYSFQVDQEFVVVYINPDGTVDLDYEIFFSNDASADPIDFVDLGLPNTTYRISDIFAEVNGTQITDIEDFLELRKNTGDERRRTD